jgi:NAD dependent epimerase/dehydratase family
MFTFVILGERLGLFDTKPALKKTFEVRAKIVIIVALCASLGEDTLGNSVKVLVTGAGGFIGHHLVSFLRAQDYWVRGVDLKPPEFCASDANEFELLDLRNWQDCLRATAGINEVYALAADMGGMGFISCNHAQILHNVSI